MKKKISRKTVLLQTQTENFLCFEIFADDLEFCSITLKAQEWALISAVNFVELGLDLGLKGKAQALKNQTPFSFRFNKRGDKRTIIVGWLNHASTNFYQSQLS